MKRSADVVPGVHIGRWVAIIGFLLVVWGFLLTIVEPGLIPSTLFLEQASTKDGTHLFLVGPLVIVYEVVVFISSLPAWVILIPGAVLLVIGLIPGDRRRESGTKMRGGLRLRGWKDPRNRLLDDLKRELRRYR